MKENLPAPRVPLRPLKLMVALSIFLAGAPLAAFIAFYRFDFDVPRRTLFLALSALFALLVSLLFAVQILSFLHALQEAAERWQSGKLDFRITPARYWSSEFHHLAASENRMAGRLNDLYRREREIAETLQTMLVASLPSACGPLRFADYYHAGSDAADIGGDFYALFILRDGRIGLVFGDIGGRGLGAAVKIAGLRYALEAYARTGMSPVEVVEYANTIVAETSVEAFVSLLYLVIDPTTGVVEMVNAGHEPPLLQQTSSGTWTSLLGDQPALGVLPGVHYHPTEFQLADGDMMLLYTDGVASVGPRRGQWSTDDLLQSIPGEATSPQSLIEGLRTCIPSCDDDSALAAFQFKRKVETGPEISSSGTTLP